MSSHPFIPRKPKEAVTFLPLIGAAIDVIGQIKDHLEAVSVE
jgi:hypothetical protein